MNSKFLMDWFYEFQIFGNKNTLLFMNKSRRRLASHIYYKVRVKVNFGFSWQKEQKKYNSNRE